MKEETQVPNESNRGCCFGMVTEELTSISDPKGIEYMVIDDDDGYTD